MAGTKRSRRKGRLAAAGDAPRAGAGKASPSPKLLATQRERVKSDLLTFPEAAVLDERQLYEAVDRILKESTPSTATPTAQGMLRFDDECIRETFHCAKFFVTPTTEDHPPSGVSPGWLDDRRRMLDEEMKPEKRVDPDNTRFLLAKIRVDLLTKGYVEIPKAYVENPPPPLRRSTISPPKKMTSVVAG